MVFPRYPARWNSTLFDVLKRPGREAKRRRKTNGWGRDRFAECARSIVHTSMTNRPLCGSHAFCQKHDLVTSCSAGDLARKQHMGWPHRRCTARESRGIAYQITIATKIFNFILAYFLIIDTAIWFYFMVHWLLTILTVNIWLILVHLSTFLYLYILSAYLPHRSAGLHQTPVR